MCRLGRVHTDLAARPDVQGVQRRDEKEVAFRFLGAETELHRIVRAIVQEEVALVGLVKEEKDLEALFMAVTKGKVQ